MKISTFYENDSVLLVGEGNFSFSVALLQHNINIKLIATCYESVVNQIAGKKNIEYLLNNGVCVLFGVDATKLEECIPLKSKLFDKIIFNFPHIGGKMRIEKNRDLLKNFFISSEKIIKQDGQVLVTLCNGQGGTLMDNPMRRWDDSWKIVEMAAYGNFILTKIEPFLWSSFQDYIVTGYRGLEKPFYIAGALTHFLKKTEPPTIYNIAPGNRINNISVHNTDNITWKEIVNRIQNISNYDIASIYPCTFQFDLTLSTTRNFNTAEFYQLLYNYAGSIIDNVVLIDHYMSPTSKQIKRTYRIYYKSDFLPLYRKRTIELHQTIITNFIEDTFKITVSR